jgi:hypothetical protein
MPFTAGTFTKLFSWLIDPVRNEKIFNSRLDDEFSGIATALSTAILKDGTQTTTASIPFAQGISTTTLAATGIVTRTGQPAFSAHKNGTNQTGIANATFTKITFGTERFDVNGNYDAANSKWTPPAGKVLITGAVFWNVGTTVGNFILSVFKNGVRYDDQITTNYTAVSALGNMIAIVDDANGTDFYELYGFGSTGTTLTIDGTASATYFMGYML